MLQLAKIVGSLKIVGVISYYYDLNIEEKLKCKKNLLILAAIYKNFGSN